jgi:two-component system, OmpR family, response regulator
MNTLRPTASPWAGDWPHGLGSSAVRDANNAATLFRLPWDKGSPGEFPRQSAPQPGSLNEEASADSTDWQSWVSVAGCMRILVVEDDNKIASFVVKGLKQAGYAVDHCADGEEGLTYAETTSYDAAVVDVMLPKLDGLSLIQRLRSKKIRIPVIILSAKASVEDRVKGLQAGADDYLTKPFAFSELIARVQALIRRASQTSEPTRLQVGDLSLDLLTREVMRGAEKVELQTREFALLEYLMRQSGRIVTKTMILEHIFDYSFDPQTNVVDVLVHRLRAKIDPGRTRLHTIRSVGYVLKAA